ncbi:MAG: DNA-primase RepB domain-containing protein [Gallionellaceae bacterium]
MLNQITNSNELGLTVETQALPANDGVQTNNVLTFPAGEPLEAGKAGKAGDIHITNAEFIAAVFPQLPEGAFAAACSISGDPSDSKNWSAKRADNIVKGLAADRNNYINCSSFFQGADGSFRAIKKEFAAYHSLMFDDIGTKIPSARLGEFKPSWVIETSPGNFQVGIILSEPITDGDVAVRLLRSAIEAELCDPGAHGPLTRWARLPVGINGKAKHADGDGNPFSCRLVEWSPESRYTPQEIVDGLGLVLAPEKHPKKGTKSSSGSTRSAANDGDDVLTPRATENPVVSELTARGLYKTPLGSGKHEITCPWVHEHTDELDTGAAYFEPDDIYPLGGFCCQHSHREKYHIRQLLDFLGVSIAEAKHKPIIRVVAGDLHRVVNAAEKELAGRGRHYQSGGLIVSVSTDPVSGDPSIVPINSPALTKELSAAATWAKFDGRSKDWVLCDPPERHVGILYNAQAFRHLPTISGLARQPYFRESDGELITQAGYDPTSQRFGVFDSRKFVIPENPTMADAQAGLALLEGLLDEFHFVAPADRSAALSAIFTAVVRPMLAHAPAFHVKAPIFGSGKSYLCELIGAFAGPARNTKVSFPTTAEEATKSLLSLLLSSPAVIEFDDMATDWIPHGTILRMLTAEQMTDRVLGVSKTATVSTRTLFLSSGNNVGPVRDLLRRVLTIHVDARCATPAMISYTSDPVDRVRKNRELYVAAVLTIIMAYRQAGSPRTSVKNIVTFGGAWTDYCRQPLLWLGHPDPATALFEQIKDDPDGDALSGLMTEWQAIFGSKATTIRKALIEAESPGGILLLDAMRECPVEDKGEINRSKLGWFLKKSANRVVNGLMFQQARADGRAAWKVVVAAPPASPPLPPPSGPVVKTVTTAESEVLV